MKKKMVAMFVVLSLVLSAVFSMAACGSKEPDKSGGDKQGSDKAAETKKEEGPSQGSGETIKIGLITQLTGSSTQTGTEVQYMADLIEDVINTKMDINLPFHNTEGLPGLGGAKVEVVVGDGSTADVAMAEAERLITEEGVIGIVSNCGSAATKTIMVPAEKYGCIVLTEGTSVTLTEAGYRYWGRTFPGDDLFCRDSFEFIKYMNEKEGAGIKTCAVVAEDSEFGTNMANVMREYAGKYDLEIVEDITYSATAANVTSEVLRLKKADPDVVLMSSYAADALLFMTTYKDQEYAPKMLIGQRGGFSASDFITNLGADSDYVLSTGRWNADVSGELGIELSELYQKEYSGGIELVGDVLTDSWNIMLIAAIANQAGSTKPEDMRAVMSKGVNIDPAQDPTGAEGYVYGENGQNERTVAIMLQMKDGKRHTVFPAEKKSADAIYPAPAWTER